MMALKLPAKPPARRVCMISTEYGVLLFGGFASMSGTGVASFRMAEEARLLSKCEEEDDDSPAV